MARNFVLVRLVKISGADLSLFEFDHDLTWMGFFLTPDERVVGRYGGRDARGAETRMSLLGLRFAMQAALDARRHLPAEAPPRAAKPVLAEEYPAARRLGRGECIHCHQVNEFRRAARQEAGLWKRDEVWVYPLPENVGITLEIDRGNHVRAVAPDSPAARAGVKAGDVLLRLNDVPVASFADAQHALHRAPGKGEIPLRWRRGAEEHSGTLALAEGWRRTNVTWRPSMLDILPSLSLYGEDLTAGEKKALGLSAKRLAFRQDDTVHSSMRAVGVRPRDIIVGINGEPLEMTMLELLGHVRRSHLVGDRITLNVIRDGKRLDLPLTLR